MAKTNKLKIFNDPIYGFIGTPDQLIFDLIAHPYVQRLRRISQMGLSYLVYPGAHHTRFHHALGCMHLMQRAIQVLRFKNVPITKKEEEGLLCAILLHDIGHGPFSHALEHEIIAGVEHEKLSLQFMQRINQEFNGALEVGIMIFQGQYPKVFMNQLVSSQLDMDRLDYLKRDSFYTGVTEGNINSERLITMLNVVDNQLVVEEKGIYAVEKFLMARRFMYWQVYLHKTSLVAELLLVRIFKRAREIFEATPTADEDPLLFFLLNQEQQKKASFDLLGAFAQLDDVDVLHALKKWQFHDDIILAKLSSMLLNRKLLKIKIKDAPIDGHKLEMKRNWVQDHFQLAEDQVDYFVFTGEVANRAYDEEHQSISILKKNGKLVDVARASDNLGLRAFSKKVTKFYVCYPKESV
ncbi:MAG: HD domain-containing protein [Bacteroidota bacterium]